MNDKVYMKFTPDVTNISAAELAAILGKFEYVIPRDALNGLPPLTVMKHFTPFQPPVIEGVPVDENKQQQSEGQETTESSPKRDTGKTRRTKGR